MDLPQNKGLEFILLSSKHYAYDQHFIKFLDSY